MTLTEPRGIEFVRGLGVQRVILARELSAGRDRADRGGDRSAGGGVRPRGAVRGVFGAVPDQRIARRAIGQPRTVRQACRLPYDLIVDGEFRDLGDKAYLLSPQDLAAHDLIGPLVKLGVSAFKIEGRLKSAHYVAATTQTYRAALDAALRCESFRIPPQQQQELAQSFSRGFTHGFLDGPDHQKLVHARFPKSRGIRVGTVVGKTAGGLIVETEGRGSRVWGLGEKKGTLPKKTKPLVARPQTLDPSFRPQTLDPSLRPGDGIVFDEGHPEQDEQGGRIVAVSPIGGGKSRPGDRIEIRFRPGDIALAAVAIGSIVWKTDDPAIRKRLEQSYSREIGGASRAAACASLRWSGGAAEGCALRWRRAGGGRGMGAAVEARGEVSAHD